MSRKSTSTINFYEVDKVKKYLPKHNDEQKEYTGIPVSDHILIVGKTGSGKSNCLMNLIHETSKPKKGTYKKIILVVKKKEALIKYLEDRLGPDFITIYNSVEDLPLVDSLEDLSEKNDKRYLLVFDDCINEDKKINVKKILDYFTFARNKGVQVTYLSQSYFQTPIFIRKNVGFTLICGISNKRDLSLIFTDFCTSDVTPEMLNQMYKYCKEPDYEGEMPFMKLCNYQCPISKKYSKNFLEYLKPEDFGKK